MKKYFSLTFVLLISLFLVQCAKKGTPTGGKVDSIPPKFVRAAPENFSTNFDSKEIRILFNEFIKLEKPQEQIIISPPMSPKPDITPLGFASKDVRIKINDTLQENTTYVINFGRSVTDNNEGNPLPFFKYVFSTGSYIDSLSVQGRIEDALLKEAPSFISVMLYEVNETFTDSLVFNDPPRYITNTLDSLRSFEITNLKEGTYQLVAVQDLNNDYKYNPGREKIAFIENPITIPTDSSYTLTLFKEILNFKPERPKQAGLQKLLIGYKGKTELDSLSFKPLSAVPADFKYRITKIADKDSLNFWFKPKIEIDSLLLVVSRPKGSDTLLTRITDMPKDSLNVSTEPSGNVDFDKDFLFRTNTPISEKNDEFISILNKDSIPLPFTSEINTLENTLRLKFKKTENETYQITALPGALTDFFNKVNDTIKKSIRTKAFSDYGNVRLNLQNLRAFPLIVQLTDEKGVVKYERYTTSESRISFDLIIPGKYLIRVIYDRNENNIWDTGNYLKKIKAEEIIYFPDLIEVRPNWDVNQTFILD
ncbi:Ig-like domain-containing protein [Gillisia sp. Q332]|uniref:Ig-like domain-containing protein n=1 Tax=Gillisia xinjiangensis TaxID=3384765 RepID=UPI00391DEABD